MTIGVDMVEIRSRTNAMKKRTVRGVAGRNMFVVGLKTRPTNEKSDC